MRVVFTRGSGCYGINGADTVSFDAALLSQAVGRPVRVQLSRQDEMAWENFGMAFVIDQRAGVDANGNLVAWDYEAWSPALGGRPGYERPGNVVTGALVGAQPVAVAPRSPAPQPAGPLNNGSNTAPSYVAGCVGDVCRGTGTLRTERVLSHRVPSPFFTGPLRAPERLQNTFAHECFMDEVAARVGADPVEYRLRHLRDPRLSAVVKAAGVAAKWDARPSPRPNRPADRHGLGPRHRLRALRGRQRLRGDGCRGERRSSHRGDYGHASRRRAGLRTHFESERGPQPIRGRRASRHESRTLSKK